MSEDIFKNESPNRDIIFKTVLGFLFVFTMMSVALDLEQYSHHKELNIPRWYFWMIFFVDFFIICSIVFIYFYKKWAVFAYPILMGLHFYLHVFYLDTFLYNDIMALFIFTLSLIAVIPKWKFYS